MKAYFFDLDGTLTDSRSGLLPAFQRGLAAIGVLPPSEHVLTGYLGTPLPELFRHQKPDVTAAEIDAGIRAFRLAYADYGVVRNELYPGVRRMLESIRQYGATCYVVTSKPEFQAIKVVAHLDLANDVAAVIGAGLAETDTKTDLVARALKTAGVPSHDAIMVGDRHYDIIGALENNVRPVGVTWGYGTHEELKSAGCRDFVNSADEFRERFVEPHRPAAEPKSVARTSAG